MTISTRLTKTCHIYLLCMLTCFGKLNAQAGEYYRLIHLAESKVILEKYDEAIPLYNDAFANQPTPFLKDLHNALLCSIRIEDTTTAKAIIDEIVKFNIDTNFYFRSTTLADLHAAENLYVYFKSRIRKNGVQTGTLCYFFQKLYALDQSIRQACREINTNYYAICGEEIKLLDSLNLQSLNNYFTSYGVPKDIDLCQINPSTSPSYFIVIKHNMQWGRNPLDSILSEAIVHYKTHPQLYSDLVDYYNESYLKQPALYGMGYHIKLGNRLFVFEVPAELKAAINASRQAIYLDSIDEFNNKVKFQYQHPEFILVYPQLLFTLDAGPEMEKELAEKWKDAEVFKN